MSKKLTNRAFSDETLAAFLDGNATAEESLDIIHSMAFDAELRELLRISNEVDADLGIAEESHQIVNIAALAALCEESNYCCLECEKHILTRRGVEYDADRLLEVALRNKWQKEDGTALFNVGRHLESFDFVVERRYGSTVEDIAKALERGDDVIVAVREGVLLCDKNIILEASKGDMAPNHTIVVLALNMDKGEVVVFDPNSRNATDSYPLAQFMDAWSDSKYYMVTSNHKDVKAYAPKPIDISDVVLGDDIEELREAIAENAHEIWAQNRMAEGWTYGPERNDALKQTPDMVPYSQLPDSEREYDRKMAMQTISLMRKLGYDIVKSHPTTLYNTLKYRLRHADREEVCPHCGGVLYEGQKYCDRCGTKIR